MARVHYPPKKVEELKQGDVVYTPITFEENTTDFYHGHRVYDVISRAVTDKSGNTLKWRPAIIMGKADGELFVAPLTTKNNAGHDYEHQMKLIHTENLPKSENGSFVEVSNMRRIPVKNDREIPFITEAHNEDMSRLKERYRKEVKKDTLYNVHKDSHTFVEDKDELKKTLLKKGYSETENGFEKGNHSISFKGDIATSHYDVSLEDTLKKHHKHAHLTFRSGAQRNPCSPQVDLLVDDVQEMLGGIRLDFQSTNHLPGGLDAKTTPARTRIQMRAATDHGAVSELGHLVLKMNRISQDKLPEFVTWYEQEHGLDVINPVEVKTDFSNIGLSNTITVDDLNIKEQGLQQ